MRYRLDFDLKSFTGTAFRPQIIYRNGVPDRSGLLSPLQTILNYDQDDIFYIVLYV